MHTLLSGLYSEKSECKHEGAILHVKYRPSFDMLLG